MNTVTHIIWFNDSIVDDMANNPTFTSTYRVYLNESTHHAAMYLENTYGMVTRDNCFSMEDESKYNMLLLKFSKS